MPRSIQLIGVYKLPASLTVSEGCLGKRIKIAVGGLSGKARLPKLDWSGEDPCLVMPDLPPAIKDRAERYITAMDEGWRYWGGVGSWNQQRRSISGAYIEAVGVEFKVPLHSITYSGYTHGRGQPQGPVIDGLFSEIDSWFDRVRTWVEAAIDQDADPHYPINSAMSPGRGLMLMTEEDGAASLPASSSTIYVTMTRCDVITLPILYRVIRQANEGAAPSDPHLLLRDSRAALRRDHLRRAVIDAGSAVELALADFNSRVIHVSPARGRLPTLGWYVKQAAIAAGAGVPTNTQVDLVNVRNDAIHQNRVPSRDETILALGLSKGIVDRVDPLAF